MTGYVLLIYILSGGPQLAAGQAWGNPAMPLQVCLDLADKINRPNLFLHNFDFRSECVREDVANKSR